MKINTEIVRAAAEYVTSFMQKNLSANYCYHNFSHTVNVVKAVSEIAAESSINDHELGILLTAAWFHDIGYVWQIDGHEMAAASLAEAFLEEKDVDAGDIQQVRGCILATKYPQNPNGDLEAIICDADMIHIGEKGFFEKNELIRKEWGLTRDKKYSNEQWYELNLDFVGKHSFHTTYCRENKTKQQKKTIKTLEKFLREEKRNPSGADKNTDTEQGISKIQKLERGVETLFKTASRNHMQLSSMADSKAHILLSINSIIISIILSVLTKRLEQSSYLLVPTSLLLLVCLATIVFAVLTTKPKISKGIFTRDQVARREANLMFFGNFHNMDLQTYDWGVKEIMNDKDYLYSSMTRDVYYLGKVLAIKYRYLNIGYKIFMYGLIISVLAYGISFFCAGHA